MEISTAMCQMRHTNPERWTDATKSILFVYRDRDRNW